MPPCVRHASLPTRLVGDELLVVDRGRGLVHRLNRSAARIWAHCDGTLHEERIAERFAADVGCDASDVRDDVRRTLDAFDRLGLLEHDPVKAPR